ncbi:MAG: hypothetical protein K2G67_03460, partial [Muribaculaceae bacterium]|nr:hypothetical protein [Muribaculaceae bacterium]
PEGQAHRRRCAVSPTFATGKLNEPMTPKNENEITGNSIQESEEPKNRRSVRFGNEKPQGSMQGAVSRCLQLWQVHRGVSLWLDLLQIDYDTINCKAVHARQTHSANKGSDCEGVKSIPLKSTRDNVRGRR